MDVVFNQLVKRRWYYSVIRWVASIGSPANLDKNDWMHPVATPMLTIANQSE
jgi:hypothetical protein